MKNMHSRICIIISIQDLEGFYQISELFDTYRKVLTSIAWSHKEDGKG